MTEVKSMKKRNKVIMCLLLTISIATISIGMKETSTNLKNNNLIDSFYQSVNYNPAKGILIFTVPKSIPKGYKFFLHVSGRLYMEDKFSGMSFHAFDEEILNYSWVNGKTYTYPLNSEGLDFCDIIFGLVDKDTHENLYLIHILPDGSKSIEKTD